MKQFYVVRIEPNDSNSVLVYARPKGDLPTVPPHIFNVQRKGKQHLAAEKALNSFGYWDVDMDAFTTPAGNGLRHEELVTIDIESILRKSINYAMKAQMGEMLSPVAELYSETEMRDNARNQFNDNTEVFEGIVMTDDYRMHRFYPLLAEDGDEAFKVILSALHQRLRHEVAESEILTCEIKHHGRVIYAKGI